MKQELMRKIKRFCYKITPVEKYPKVIKFFYKLQVGEKLNMDNPQTFNEKVQWLKLNDTRHIKTVLADKYAVREWVKEKIGEQYLIPLIGVWNSPDEIPFDSLPQRYVLKPNHGCGYNIIVTDKEKIDVKAIKRKLSKWLKIDYSLLNGELQYRNIERKIIAEEYMENRDGEIDDYKVFCFNGKPEYIMFLCDRHNGLKMAFFDTKWNKQEFTYSYPLFQGRVPKPGHLTEMLELAAILAKGFPHVRVDFYVLNDGSLKFGEMTFASAGGCCKWNPEKYDRILGDKINLDMLSNNSSEA